MSKRKEGRPKQNIRVFLSYAKEDNEQAKELMEQFAKQPNVNVFTTAKISAGQNWQAMIKRALADSHFFVASCFPRLRFIQSGCSLS
jgi:ABC-type lipoprotein export system ATPase subunit